MKLNQTLCVSCRTQKLTVVLDLDKTLIFAANKYIIYHNVTPFMQVDNFNIYKRPHLDVFVNHVFKKYNVFIWTAAQKTYAHAILTRLLTPSVYVPVGILIRKQTMIYKNCASWSPEANKDQTTGKVATKYGTNCYDT